MFDIENVDTVFEYETKGNHVFLEFHFKFCGTTIAFLG